MSTSLTAPIIPAQAAEQAPVLSPAQLIAIQQRRYSTKKFDPARIIPADAWQALEQSLLLSPSSNGLQPWRFLVITERALKEKLVPLSRGQRQVADASHLVVFQGREGIDAHDIDRWVDLFAEVRQTPADAAKAQRERLNAQLLAPRPGFSVAEFVKYQIYIALGNFLTAAAALGIDTCPVGGFDPDAYDRELGLVGSGYRSVVLAPAGYRAADDHNATSPKVRFPLHDIVSYR